MKRCAWGGLATALVLSGCRSVPSVAVDEGLALPPGQNGASASETEHLALPTRVRLSDQVVRDAGIRTTPVATAALPNTMDLTGEVAYDPDRAAMITARAPGRIVDIRFKEGDRVARGATLAVIESPALARARADYSTALSRFKTALETARRLANLAAKGLASGQEVALAEMEARNARVSSDAAAHVLDAFGPEARSHLDAGARLTVSAPLGGYALGRNAVRGQQVPSDHLLTTVVDFDEAFFVARLFEKDLSAVSAGSTAEVRLNAYPAYVFTGEVESLGRQIDPVARTVVARIRVRNHQDLLKHGLFGSARLIATEHQEPVAGLLVPLSSVTQIGERNVVFVLEDGGDYEIHPVTLGRSAEGRVQVLAGLNPAEHVVHDGVFVLKSAALKSTFGEEQ